MEKEGRNMKLPDSYIECMKKVFNDTVNKYDDPSMVLQEDLLNHKPPVPTNLEQPPSFKEILETHRQDWYDPPTSPSNDEPCKEELHLKHLAMEGAGGISHSQILTFRTCHKRIKKFGSKPTSKSKILNLSKIRHR
ncbi:hypothetical protein R1flu_010786 [Riccia fluitans]|uniref:Uncharacterized protein n=1 Tax=Riccia fluitans TaxID=41844 RepID=A0ABD1Z5Z1_9MARC